jgi:hypothetical protein
METKTNIAATTENSIVTNTNSIVKVINIRFTVGLSIRLLKFFQTASIEVKRRDNRSNSGAISNTSIPKDVLFV